MKPPISNLQTPRPALLGTLQELEGAIEIIDRTQRRQSIRIRVLFGIVCVETPLLLWAAWKGLVFMSVKGHLTQPSPRSGEGRKRRTALRTAANLPAELSPADRKQLNFIRTPGQFHTYLNTKQKEQG